MRSQEEKPVCILVVPFFRASVKLRGKLRRLFSKDLAHAEFEGIIANASIQFRQNVERIFAASLLAANFNARLAFVEGWKSNLIVSPKRGSKRVVPGSKISALILRMLQRRGLTAYNEKPLRMSFSRCTAEEVLAISRITIPGCTTIHIFGITGSPSPSAARAARVLGIAGRRPYSVFTPRAAISKHDLALTGEQAGVMQAAALSRGEKLTGMLSEIANWMLHYFSRFIGFFTGGRLSLEVYLAHLLRRDQQP